MCGNGMVQGVTMVLLMLVHLIHLVAGQTRYDVNGDEPAQYDVTDSDQIDTNFKSLKREHGNDLAVASGRCSPIRHNNTSPTDNEIVIQCIILGGSQLFNGPDNILFENLGISTRISVGVSNRNSAPESCTTPEGQQGQCRLVSECQSYLPFIQDIRDTDVRQFFIERVCRLVSQAIEICCPLNSDRPPSISSSTQTPTTPTILPPTFPIKFDQDSQLQPGQGRPAQQPPRRPLTPSQRPNGRKPIIIGSPSGDSPSLFTQTSTQPTPGPPSSITPAQPTSSTVEVPRPQPIIPDRIGATVPDRQGITSPDTDELPVTSSIIPSVEECGFFISNNRSTRQNSWPWLVSLGQLKESDFEVACGAALITRRHVLSAAHCLTDSRLPKPTHVRLRTYNLGQSNDLAASEDVPILDFTDAGYNDNSFENDLAIVTLSKDVTFNDFVYPVCLPFNFEYDGFRYQDLNVVGWRSTLTETSSRAQQTELQDVQVSVTGLGDCRTTFQKSVNTLVVDRRQLCGLGGAKACVTDNGAPMFFLDDHTTNRYFIVGIVSYGFGCQKPDLPGVYTRVGAFLDWIQKNLK